MDGNYLDSAFKEFQYYKSLGDKTLARLTDEQLNWTPNLQSNSIATIVHHMSGNMLSRFTDFLTKDGEKPWRNRDAEFEPEDTIKESVLSRWEKGWACLMNTIDKLREVDLSTIVYIRGELHTIIQAINRQIAHYAYHTGQIIFIAKMLLENWQSLSIGLGGSATYNASKFDETK